MPTETFLKLTEDKKKKIIQSAKKEFSRVPFVETSIKNIVQEAGIARGSFYQYFEGKEDLLVYILQDHIKGMEQVIEQTLKQTKGDIFEAFIAVYDYMVNDFMGSEEQQFFKNIFENMRTSDDEILYRKMRDCKPPEMLFQRYIPFIDTTNLKASDSEEMELILKMLSIITKKAIVSRFKYPSKQKAKQGYLKQIEYLKQGILKKEGGNPC